jgi:hypothetical protein
MPNFVKKILQGVLHPLKGEADHWRLIFDQAFGVVCHPERRLVNRAFFEPNVTALIMMCTLGSRHYYLLPTKGLIRKTHNYVGGDKSSTQKTILPCLSE